MAKGQTWQDIADQSSSMLGSLFDMPVGNSPLPGDKDPSQAQEEIVTVNMAPLTAMGEQASGSSTPLSGMEQYLDQLIDANIDGSQIANEDNAVELLEKKIKEDSDVHKALLSKKPPSPLVSPTMSNLAMDAEESVESYNPPTVQANMASPSFTVPIIGSSTQTQNSPAAAAPPQREGNGQSRVSDYPQDYAEDAPVMNEVSNSIVEQKQPERKTPAPVESNLGGNAANNIGSMLGNLFQEPERKTPAPVESNLGGNAANNIGSMLGNLFQEPDKNVHKSEVVNVPVGQPKAESQKPTEFLESLFGKPSYPVPNNGPLGAFNKEEEQAPTEPQDLQNVLNSAMANVLEAQQATKTALQGQPESKPSTSEISNASNNSPSIDSLSKLMGLFSQPDSQPSPIEHKNVNEPTLGKPSALFDEEEGMGKFHGKSEHGSSEVVGIVGHAPVTKEVDAGKQENGPYNEMTLPGGLTNMQDLMSAMGESLPEPKKHASQQSAGTGKPHHHKGKKHHPHRPEKTEDVEDRSYEKEQNISESPKSPVDWRTEEQPLADSTPMKHPVTEPESVRKIVAEPLGQRQPLAEPQKPQTPFPSDMKAQSSEVLSKDTQTTPSMAPLAKKGNGELNNGVSGLAKSLYDSLFQVNPAENQNNYALGENISKVEAGDGLREENKVPAHEDSGILDWMLPDFAKDLLQETPRTKNRKQKRPKLKVKVPGQSEVEEQEVKQESLAEDIELTSSQKSTKDKEALELQKPKDKVVATDEGVNAHITLHKEADNPTHVIIPGYEVVREKDPLKDLTEDEVMQAITEFHAKKMQGKKKEQFANGEPKQPTAEMKPMKKRKNRIMKNKNPLDNDGESMEKDDVVDVQGSLSKEEEVYSGPSMAVKKEEVQKKEVEKTEVEKKGTVKPSQTQPASEENTSTSASDRESAATGLVTGSNCSKDSECPRGRCMTVVPAAKDTNNKPLKMCSAWGKMDCGPLEDNHYLPCRKTYLSGCNQHRCCSSPGGKCKVATDCCDPDSHAGEKLMRCVDYKGGNHFGTCQLKGNDSRVNNSKVKEMSSQETGDKNATRHTAAVTVGSLDEKAGAGKVELPKSAAMTKGKAAHSPTTDDDDEEEDEDDNPAEQQLLKKNRLLEEKEDEDRSDSSILYKQLSVTSTLVAVLSSTLLVLYL
eukprot:Nk52_evm4s365 gene=Nk52_evmTU4s365